MYLCIANIVAGSQVFLQLMINYAPLNMEMSCRKTKSWTATVEQLKGAKCLCFWRRCEQLDWGGLIDFTIQFSQSTHDALLGQICSLPICQSAALLTMRAQKKDIDTRDLSMPPAAWQCTAVSFVCICVCVCVCASVGE